MKQYKYFYIAGPYTKNGEGKNVAVAIRYADFVRKHGGIPFIPHLYHFWDMIYPHDYDYWMELCLDWLTKCDGLIRIPGESKGADIEVQKAKELGIPIYTIKNFISLMDKKKE